MKILDKVLFVILTLFFIVPSLHAQEKKIVFRGTGLNKTIAENRPDNIPSQINPVIYRSLNLSEPVELDKPIEKRDTLRETLIEYTRQKIFSEMNMTLDLSPDTRDFKQDDFSPSKSSGVDREWMKGEVSPNPKSDRVFVGPKSQFTAVEENNQPSNSLNREFFTTEFGKARLEDSNKFPFGKSSDDTNRSYTTGKFHWKNAIAQSLTFLTIQHMARLPQPRTNSRLGGRFFADWFKSARNLKGWADGDNFITNYLEHGMQGSATGRIFVNNSEKSRLLQFGKSKAYWRSRAKALAWSAVWSAQFELGPISEASIGNVGIDATKNFSHMSYQDLVLTPTIGTAMLIGSDLVDKYVLRKWLERKAETRMGVRLLRMFLTPVHAFVNAISGRAPWKRYGRF